MNAHASLPATLRSLPEIIDEYHAKQLSIESVIDGMRDAIKKVELNASVAGEFVGSVCSRADVPHASAIQDNLLRSAWKHVYKGLSIDRIASAKDRSQFSVALEKPPEFTLENIRSTFGDYLVNSRHHILKGLAEAFADLDPAYKSHSKVKIGVSGMPKRVIIENCIGEGSYGSYGVNKLRDTINALRVFRGQPHLTHNELDDFIRLARLERVGIREWKADERYPSRSAVMFDGKIYVLSGRTAQSAVFAIGENDTGSAWHELVSPEPGLTMKGFKNGNAHLIFDQAAMFDINKALAEFYGEVLPDTPDENAQKRGSTAVSKDLQFYPTPVAVLNRMLDGIYLGDGSQILEPSCGDGAILDKLRSINTSSGLKLTGIEVDAGRAAQAKAKGHAVLVGNFLHVAANPKFDYVVMNPPFYGLHWRKHLIHALKFVKPGGKLFCVLPASAYYDGHLEGFGVTDERWGDKVWNDLPVGSFASSGTNVPTGYVRIGVPK